MKLITFCVPCYNSEHYLKNCAESLLVGGDDVEIIIVNDGSTDGTAAIADEFVRKYPHIVKVVHKSNGGHGSGVNKGLECASGLYYKVVDSDDWVDEDSLLFLLDTLRRHAENQTLADLYITDFVYEKIYANSRYVRSFKKNFPSKVFFGWEEVKPFKTSSMLIMHSLLYSTEKLRESKTVLPEHTFYVDNLFAYEPLPIMKKICYLEIPLYRYFIGRSDQSVSAENITKRYKQQIRVMKRMIGRYSFRELKEMPKGLSQYMLHALAVVMTLTVTFISAGKDCAKERKTALKDLWTSIKRQDRKLYHYLKYNTYTAFVNWLPFRLQGRATWLGYKYYRKKLKCS